MENTDRSTAPRPELQAGEPEPIKIRKLDRLETTSFISTENES
jgi:hypothetical protein